MFIHRNCDTIYLNKIGNLFLEMNVAYMAHGGFVFLMNILGINSQFRSLIRCIGAAAPAFSNANNDKEKFHAVYNTMGEQKSTLLLGNNAFDILLHCKYAFEPISVDILDQEVNYGFHLQQTHRNQSAIRKFWNGTHLSWMSIYLTTCFYIFFSSFFFFLRRFYRFANIK